MLDKVIPHNVDAEEAVIGALLIDAECMAEVADLVSPEDFYREKNAWAFEACKALFDRHEPIDLITVANEIAQKGRIEALGGAAYLSGLVSLVPTSLDAPYYARIVRSCALARRLISAGAQISALGYGAEADPESAIVKAEEALRSVGLSTRRDGIRPLPELVAEYKPHVDEFWAAQDGVMSIPTGFAKLDEYTGGLSGLSILGGRTSNCKTLFAGLVAAHQAVSGRSVVIFSADSEWEKLIDRWASRLTKKSARVIRYMYNDEYRIACQDSYHGALDQMAKWPGLIGIDDTRRLSRSRIESRLSRWIVQNGKPSLLIYDYVEQYTHKGRSREEEVSQVIQDFGDIAKGYDIPTLALSQLNRGVDDRAVPRPELTDLRYSGMSEQEAYIVLLVWWPNSYREQLGSIADGLPRDYVEVIVAKNKDGPRGAKFGLRIEAESANLTEWEGPLPIIKAR